MAKVMVDSSAWIHFLRGTSPVLMNLVRQLILEDSVVICGPIITEVLRGARNLREEKLLRDQFDLLPFCSLDQKDYFEAAALSLTLRKKGWTVNTIDLLIAHVCLRDQLKLLHDDSDFEGVARWTRLKTIRV